MTSCVAEPGSFRDPSGHVFLHNDRVLRTVTERAVADYEFVRDTGLTITVCWAFLALCGPWLVPYDPLQGDAGLAAAPPSLTHPFGLDEAERRRIVERALEMLETEVEPGTVWELE